MEGQMRKFLVAVLVSMISLYAVPAFATSLDWDPVTQYTDNTTIGPEANGIFYNVEMDGTTRAAKISALSWTLPAVTKGSAHQFRVQTELGALDNTGVPYRSAWSPAYGWTSPLVTPRLPGGLRVSP
jgi:hypothetical protein